MNMQIKDIVLYGENNKTRVLRFKTGEVNIITGDPKTGKTALIDIVDYCLGRKDCPISEGKIRENVEWFGLRVQFEFGQVFIARQNPSYLDRQSTTGVYLEQGDNIEIPQKSELITNSTTDSLVSFLSNKLSISANLNIPPEGQTRSPLESTLDHSKLFCFQRQNVIDQPGFLFHRQSEPFMPQAIKDSLPYFLGAVREDNLKLEQELAIKKRDLKRAEREFEEALKIKENGISKAFELIEEAKQLHLLNSEIKPKDIEEAIKLLNEVLKWEKEDDEITAENENLYNLQSELRELENQFTEKNENLRAAKIFANEAEGYTDESKQHELRLESINLYNDNLDNNIEICPVCSNKLKVPTPTALEINKSIKSLRSNLEITSKERPKLREYINKLDEEKTQLKEKITIVKNKIKAINQEQESAKKLKEMNIRKGRVIGRISLFLESIDLTDNYSELHKKVETLRLEIEKIEQLISPEERDAKLSSILNKINYQMSELAKSLDLEYRNNPLRFDIKKLTLFVDAENGEIPLQKIGSGENWVSYHLLIHLSLHRHFITNNRPVPNFLFLDQPSQAYYPPDKEKGSSTISIDERNYENLFNLIFDLVNSMDDKFQIILTDHANLKNNVNFQKSILEEWRNGKKLVPTDWYELPT